MKKNVTEIRSFKRLLKATEPFVKNFAELMLKEPKFPGLSLRPLEVWGNWLLCAVLRKNISGEISFGDDGEGDGLILDKTSGLMRETEHTSATDNPNSPIQLPSGDRRIIDAIFEKINMNYGHAKNLALVVFFDGAKEWHRDKIREAVNGKHKFWKIFLISLLKKDDSGYSYTVTELFEIYSVTHIVKINSDFTHWTVEKFQEPNQV